MFNPTSIKNEPHKSSNFINYTEVLEFLGIQDFSQKEYYIQIGNISEQQGWIIHLSVWNGQFEELSKEIFPLLIEFNIPFLIPANNIIHNLLLSGSFGYKNLGKIIIIFPTKETSLSILANELITRTPKYRGPFIPTDFHLGNIVYTRFGSYNPTSSGLKKTIKNPLGEIIEDEETIPPKLYNWLPWPYDNIAPEINKDSKLLNNKYLILKTIKPDVKGRVMIGIYQPNFYTIKKCLIKEGKYGMGIDHEGREISDRLNWQYEIYKKIKNSLPIPKVLDFFTEKKNTYLIFEFIKGETFRELLVNLSEGNSWESVAIKKRVFITQKIIESIKLLDNLHSLGYVHRDLNVENIFIDKNGKLWLMDFELAYNFNKKIPNPPFDGGTDGYMSPEQNNYLAPKIEQDIYSIGAILIMTLINISPYRFNLSNPILLRRQLLFFVKDENIVNLIISCLSLNSNDRPSIAQIVLILNNYLKKLDQSHNEIYKTIINKLDLGNIINKGLYALSQLGSVNTNNHWVSPISNTDSYIGNLRMDKTIYLGFRKGISGILFFIGHASYNGLNISSCNDTWKKNYELLSHYFFANKNEIPTGLFKGTYGIAMGLMSLMRAKLIATDKVNLDFLLNCFEKKPISLELADGVAGYGTALLKCRHFLPEEFLKQRLLFCIRMICSSQLSNGAWNFDNPAKKKIVITGFQSGVAGIIWFLLNYLELYTDKKVEIAAIKSLQYLQIKAYKNKKEYLWKIGSRSKEFHQFNNGGYHMLLPFIKAYQITKKEIYRKIVEGTLKAYPFHVTADFVSVERGVAGLGLVYLMAWKAFENREWLDRAEWIADLLIHTSYEKKDFSYWIQFDPQTPYADLLTGNSGILYFLLQIRSFNPELFIY